MRVHLGGHLSFYGPQRRSRLEIPLAAPITLAQLIEQLGLPTTEIALLVINGAACGSYDVQVSDSDEVEFFPPVGGGSLRRKS